MWHRGTLSLGALLMGIMAPAHASAYIGPGAGLSAIGTTVALIAAFVLLVAGFVWYPVKRLLRGRQADKSGEPEAPEGR